MEFVQKFSASQMCANLTIKLFKNIEHLEKFMKKIKKDEGFKYFLLID